MQNDLLFIVGNRLFPTFQGSWATVYRWDGQLYNQ